MTLFDIEYDDFKREDTTNVIAITLYTDDKQPITPNASHTWKAKVSKGDKYVGEYPVTISGNTIKLSSSNLTRLPNGDYGLELWETYDGSTTIYPSAGVMEFRVHRNANDTLGTVDPTIDINGIIDDLHKAGQNIKVVATNTLSPGSKASVTQSIANGENQLTFNIPQGIQGEKGEIGPAPTLKIGTVTKLNPDQTPTASFSGGNGSYTLDLGIPQGVQGETNATATQALDIANSLKESVKRLGGDNLAPLVVPAMCNVGTETESVTHGHAQRFALPIGGTELLPKTNILVDVLSGDTLSQSFVIETDATSIDGAFTFYMMSSDHHVVPFNVQQLTATKYLVSASYTTENDDKWRILDIMRLNLTGGTYVEFSNPYAAIDLSGGVVQTNLLADWATNNALSNWTTNDTTVQAKITNAVLSFDVKSSSAENIDFYKKDVNLTPGHTYKLSYMARGTGIMRSHLYPWTNKGATSETDSLHFTTLTDDWQESTQTIKYDPTSDNSSNTKHFLFRWKKSDCESLTGQISDLELIDVTE